MKKETIIVILLNEVQHINSYNEYSRLERGTKPALLQSMKHTLLTPFLFAILFTTASCSNQGANSYDFSEFQVEAKSTADSNDAKERLDNAIARIRLKSITDVAYKDETLQKLQAEIAASRVARSNALLNEISTPEERIDISNVQISTNEVGQLILNVETIEEVDQVKSNLMFTSEESDNEHVPFNYTSGKNNHEVKARGYCINLRDQTCYNLVVEVSFVLKDRAVIRQYNFAKPLPEVEEKEVVVEQNEDVIEAPAQEEEIVERSEPVPVDETKEIIVSRDEPEVKAEEPIEKIEEEVVVIQDELERPVDVIEATPEEEIVVDESVQLEKAEEVQEEVVEEIEEELVVDEEPSSAPLTSLRPQLRPDRAPKTSLRPVPRPDNFEEIVQAAKHDDDAESIGGGLYILPDAETNGETPTLHFRDVGVETDSYAKLEGEDVGTVSDNLKNELYERLQTKIYNQSRGAYSAFHGGGWLVNSTALPNNGDHNVVPRVKSKSFGSGLTTDTLQWLGDAYLRKYPNDSLCVNHISDHNGGHIGHKSHENGLDVDMNIPSSATNCRRRGLQHYTTYYKQDGKFFEKNYDLLKMLIGTNKVHVIFVDSSFIRRMCTYTNTLDLSEDEKKQRKEIFNRLWHVDGHINHYHIRMKCNAQNVGCKSQAEFKPNVSTTCD